MSDTKFTPQHIAARRKMIADAKLPMPVRWTACDTSVETDGTITYESAADVTGIFTIDMEEYVGLSDETAQAIAVSLNEYPRALDEIERLRDALERIARMTWDTSELTGEINEIANTILLP